MIINIFEYIYFLLTSHSRKGHGIHSPFVYDLVSHVFSKHRLEHEEKIIAWRQRLRKDNTLINGESCGAPSRIPGKHINTAGRIIQIAGIPDKYGILLYRLARKYQPKTIIELGTGPGISTCYLASGNPEAKVITMEGSIEKSNYAKALLTKEGLINIIFLTGEFEKLLPETIAGASGPLLVFIDGNHQYVPTMQYFNTILNYAGEDTIVVIDDIRWSDGMRRAWQDIVNCDKVSVSIDIFRCGITFFIKGLPKQHYMVNY